MGINKLTVYYNEIDKYVAKWLRNLIAEGVIAPGIVDERSIVDVKPDELMGYTQCHFFAGIGVWSYALRNAGWSDNRQVWTASCPCQPFSSAGKGNGFDDERHLWPHFQWLVQQCRPAAVLGEQVASKDADPWIDLVHADMEAMCYAFGCVPFPAASIGAPHIRDRNYWVGYTKECAQWTYNRQSTASFRQQKQDRGSGISGWVGDTGGESCQRNTREISTEENQICSERLENGNKYYRYSNAGDASGMADPSGDRFNQARKHIDETGNERIIGNNVHAKRESAASPTNGFWRSADWLHCRDGKWRPVEPGTFPLANGAASRVGRLRAYGNAICAPAAQAFIESFMETIQCPST